MTRSNMDKPTMKQFLKTTAVIATALASLTSVSQADDVRPNILFIAIDDLRPELGCYGNSWIKSPNIDKLAAEGTLFSRAYCQVPVCGASRASLLTGLRPTAKRFRNFDTHIEKDAPGAMTLPEEFKNNGYHCISNGKIFHHPEDTAERSWTETPWRPEIKNIAHFAPESKNMIHPKTKRGPVFESADVPDNAYYDGQVAEKTIEDLKRMKELGKPFFLSCGFIRPHLPFNAPKKYWDLYDREEIALADNQYRPKNAPKSLKGSGEFRKYHNRNIKLNSDQWHRDMRHGYYACVSYVDALLGSVLQTLDELELRENTIVVLWGDHGWHLGEHNFWGKHNVMHLSSRTPMIIAGPGVNKGQHSKQLVEFVDIYPSLCDIAGIATVNQELQGTSFRPLLTTADLPWKSAAFSRYQTGDAIITERYNYAEFKNGERMLYDLQKDPQENINIAEYPENKVLVEKLSRRLKAGWKAELP
jgi:iduronate 2-sulfatase